MDADTLVNSRLFNLLLKEASKVRNTTTTSQFSVLNDNSSSSSFIEEEKDDKKKTIKKKKLGVGILQIPMAPTTGFNPGTGTGLKI
jgi:hypothetical protein